MIAVKWVVSGNLEAEYGEIRDTAPKLVDRVIRSCLSLSEDISHELLSDNISESDPEISKIARRRPTSVGRSCLRDGSKGGKDKKTGIVTSRA
jgi:hypothetical protein